MKDRVIWISLGALLSLGFWVVLAWTLGPDLLPLPQDIFLRLGEMISSEGLLVHTWLTLSRSLLAALLALMVGFILGNYSGKKQNLEDLGSVPLLILQGTPPLVWTVPLVILLYSTRELIPAAVVFLVVLPLGIINIQSARKTLTQDKLDVFQIYAPGRRGLRVRELHLPHLSPAIQSSLTLGLVLGLKSSIIGEWVGAREGLGKLMNTYYILFDLKSFLAVTLVFLALGLSLGSLTKFLLEKFLPLKKITYKPGNLIVPVNPSIQPKAAGLSIKNGAFSYPKLSVFQNLNLKISPGSTWVLSGPSGSGKTTLARLALGIQRLNSGDITRPENPGCLFQEDGLLVHRDAVGNVALPLWAKEEKNWYSLSSHYLELVGLGDKLGSFPDELSGGQKKRLAFARALALNPGFMVLDEPFTNLDKEARGELWDLYWRLFPERGLTSLIITHYPEEFKNRKVHFAKLEKGILIS